MGIENDGHAGVAQRLDGGGQTPQRGPRRQVAEVVLPFATVPPFADQPDLIARQAQLVAAGASKTQNSRHLTGHATDLWPVDPATGKALPSDAAFKAGSAAAKAASARLWADLRVIAAMVKTIGKERGVMIEWGGTHAEYDKKNFGQ